MSALLNRLKGGDRRSIGAVNVVVRKVLNDGALVEDLVAGLWADDEVVRMRAADACEKVAARQPTWLQPYATRLLKLAEQATQQELKWHLAQMIARLRLTTPQRRRAMALLKRQLRDESRIVRVLALQALADLSSQDARLQRELPDLLRRLSQDESAAVRARARKLSAKFRS